MMRIITHENQYVLSVLQVLSNASLDHFRSLRTKVACVNRDDTRSLFLQPPLNLTLVTFIFEVVADEYCFHNY